MPDVSAFVIVTVGKLFTLIGYTALDGDSQPLLSITVYVISVEPEENPVTTPVELPIVALLVALDIQEVATMVPEPPLACDIKVVFKPTHTWLAPVIFPATGKGLTIIDNSGE